MAKKKSKSSRQNPHAEKTTHDDPSLTTPSPSKPSPPSHSQPSPLSNRYSLRSNRSNNQNEVKQKENVAEKPSKPRKMKQVVTDKEESEKEEFLKGESSGKMGIFDFDGESFGFDKMGIDENLLKRGMESVGEAEREEFDKKWKKLKIKEMKLFVKISELVQKHAIVILNELERSS